MFGSRQGSGHRLYCNPVPLSTGVHGLAGPWGGTTCGAGLSVGFGVGAVVRVPAECAVVSGMLRTRSLVKCQGWEGLVGFP